MAWYYAEGNQQKGPVDEAALDDLVRQGVVRDDTLVWRDGMASWQPHASARPRPEPPPIPDSATAEMRYCSECGRPFPAHELSFAAGSQVCPGCRPIVMQRSPAASWTAPAAASIAPAGYEPPQKIHYGGFWIRFVARLIDAILLGIVSSVIQIPLRIMLGVGALGLQGSRDPFEAIAQLPGIMSLLGLSFLIQIAIQLLYEIYFLTSRGATPGKIALGLKVIRADGRPITPGLAAGRYLGLWVSSLILFIGYIIAGFDPEKRALHDRICETRVIYARP
jgi:uncharacterized RDD family membrane protein YckC